MTESKIDPWEYIGRVSELRVGSSGDRTIIAHPRRKKPEPTKGNVEEMCIFCPDGGALVAKPYFEGDLRREMERKGLHVIDNKFPVVSSPETSQDIILPGGGITFDRIPATGRHLLLIEPNHDLNPFSDSTETRNYYEGLVWGYTKMMRSLKAEGYWWGGLGKNRNGKNKDGSVAFAGASQPHPHSQAIAMSMLPNWLESYLDTWKKTDIKKDGEGRLEACSSCLVARARRYEPLRIAADGMHVSFVSSTPAVNPYHVQIRILSYQHGTRFDEISDEGVASLSGVLHQTMMALDRVHPNCGYNFELRQGPWKMPKYGEDRLLDTYHWELRIYPASSELETMRYDGFMSHLLGMAVLTEPPESIANRLRTK